MNFETRQALEDESSLLHWYPKIKGKVPTPDTHIIGLSPKDISDLYGLLDGQRIPEPLENRIRAMANGMNVPFFLRSDQASGKHEWENTCYVVDKSKIIRHVARLVEWHAMADMLGVRFNALVFREYMPLMSEFTAFHGMPVAPEWRYFVRDGEVICKHFYWVEDAIFNPSVEDWKPLHKKIQYLSNAEEQQLCAYAQIFGQANPGYWSVDFAKTCNSGWVLIDAARGELSWHPAECIFNPDHEALMAEKNRPKPDFDSMLVRLDGSGKEE